VNITVVASEAIVSENEGISQETMNKLGELRDHGFMIVFLLNRDESLRSEREIWFRSNGVAPNCVFRDDVFHGTTPGIWKRKMTEALVEAFQSAYTVYIDPNRQDREEVFKTSADVSTFSNVDMVLNFMQLSTKMENA